MLHHWFFPTEVFMHDDYKHIFFWNSNGIILIIQKTLCTPYFFPQGFWGDGTLEDDFQVIKGIWVDQGGVLRNIHMWSNSSDGLLPKGRTPWGSTLQPVYNPMFPCNIDLQLSFVSLNLVTTRYTSTRRCGRRMRVPTLRRVVSVILRAVTRVCRTYAGCGTVLSPGAGRKQPLYGRAPLQVNGWGRDRVRTRGRRHVPPVRPVSPPSLPPWSLDSEVWTHTRPLHAWEPGPTHLRTVSPPRAFPSGNRRARAPLGSRPTTRRVAGATRPPSPFPSRVSVSAWPTALARASRTPQTAPGRPPTPPHQARGSAVS
jgi:hypothetical protein